MATNYDVRCTQCEFQRELGPTSLNYIRTRDGRREVLDPAAEEAAAKALTGLSVTELIEAGNLHPLVRYLCEGCTAFNDLDPIKDLRVCGECGGKKLVPSEELGGLECPACHNGTLVLEMVFG